MGRRYRPTRKQPQRSCTSRSRSLEPATSGARWVSRGAPADSVPISDSACCAAGS